MFIFVQRKRFILGFNSWLLQCLYYTALPRERRWCCCCFMYPHDDNKHNLLHCADFSFSKIIFEWPVNNSVITSLRPLYCLDFKIVINFIIIRSDQYRVVKLHYDDKCFIILIMIENIARFKEDSVFKYVEYIVLMRRDIAVCK